MAGLRYWYNVANVASSDENASEKKKKKSNPSNKSGERSFVIKQIKRRRHYRAVIYAFRLYISLADRFAGSFSYLFSQDNT